jgi:hypothetical protein
MPHIDAKQGVINNVQGDQINNINLYAFPVVDELPWTLPPTDTAASDASRLFQREQRAFYGIHLIS